MQEAIDIVSTQLLYTDCAVDLYDGAWSALSNAVWTHNYGHNSPSETDHSTPGFVSDWKYRTDFPSFLCAGDCNESFKTPVSPNRKICGDDGTDVAGCGFVYFTCIQKQNDRHKKQSCTRDFCDEDFRNCTNRNCKWSFIPFLNHKGSNDDDDADSEGASNPDPPSTPSYHACSVHETTVSGNHSSTTPPCGVSSHATYACQIGSNHKNAVTCPTDSNGQDCDYGSYYACSPHTHAYPSVDNTPNCSSCTDGCSSCQATCALGHVYDPSKANQVSEHKTRTCRFCSQTWHKCLPSTAPKCREPKRKKQNRHCWAAED